MPILGDPMYGRAEARAPRTMLHASRLALPHPLTGAPLVVESALPPDFAALLARLRASSGDETVSCRPHVRALRGRRR
jgi:hypothetical protein